MPRSRGYHVPDADQCTICGRAKLSHRVSHNPLGDPCISCGLPAKNHKVKHRTFGYHKPMGDPCVLCGRKNSLHKVEHHSQGNPCAKCGLEEHRHKPTKGHDPDGNPCKKCGLPVSRHRPRASHEPDGDPCKKCGKREAHHRKVGKQRTTFIGIDGEGQGREFHQYVMLAASTLDGDRTWVAEAPVQFQNSDGSTEYKRQLTTKECLDLLLSLPNANTKIFSFAFNYDLTKILTDLPDKKLYELFRPDLPSRRPTGKHSEHKGAMPIGWEGYELNLQGTKFTIRRQKDGRKQTCWDLFKFYQGKFVTAIDDWKVGDEESRAFIRRMKSQRHEFDKLPPSEVQKYCLMENRYIAELGRKLIASAEAVELDLKSFYGAGSLGNAMLEKMGVKRCMADPLEEMRTAVAAAFFGGRFENSVIGTIREKLHNWDISSAYVYQLAFLPCLAHATWKHTTDRADLSRAEAQNGALVRYSLAGRSLSRNVHGKVRETRSWGPFPFRCKDGSTAYPVESGGGWVWLDEYLAGEKIFSNVGFREAWIYERNCNCKPFEKIPEYYNHRLRIGKEGPGIVVKLGMNSCYGKLAQTLGAAKFNNWIWAGMITSGCRAQLLHMLWLHEDPANCFMLATDGLLTRETIVPPTPMETGTGTQKNDKGKFVPLGGWEHKDADKGVFIARPGIYFPLEPSESELSAIRARGVGRSVVLKSWPLLIEAWERRGPAEGPYPPNVDGKGKFEYKGPIAKMPDVERFCGAKTSISSSEKGTKFKRAMGRGHKPAYGQWISRPVEMTFDPLPKRAKVNDDGITLELRRFPLTQESFPYGKAMRRKGEELVPADVAGVSDDTRMMKAAEQEALEQPDIEYEDFQNEEG